MQRFISSILVFVFACVCIHSPATLKSVRAAGIWYVSPAGNDANACNTALAPCATLNGAISKAGDGDDIRVAIGRYTGAGEDVVLLKKSLTLSGG